jgi:hypothetical protein
MIRSIARRTALIAATAALLFQALAQPAAAAPGDVVADIILPGLNGLGPSVAFDGGFLYYTDHAGSVLHQVLVPPASSTPTAAQVVQDIPIRGAPAGIMSLSYDRARGVFWAVGGDGQSIYTISYATTVTTIADAKLMFVVNILTDRGFPQFMHFVHEVKIAYDGTDDTIWYSVDATTRIYHYHTYPSATGNAAIVTDTPFVDVAAAPNDMTAECGYSQSSGVAASATSLFVTVSGCGYYFEYTKTGVKVAAHPYAPYDDPGNGKPNQDIECDDISYAVPVFWIRDGWNGRIRAFEQPALGACAFGGGI